jgi:hypothetical protein
MTRLNVDVLFVTPKAEHLLHVIADIYGDDMDVVRCFVVRGRQREIQYSKLSLKARMAVEDAVYDAWLDERNDREQHMADLDMDQERF